MFRVVEQGPVEIPESPEASKGYMALSVVRPPLEGDTIYGRGMRDNSVCRSRIKSGGKKPFELEGLSTVLKPDDQPRTIQGYEVTGYEDPTSLPLENPFLVNPFSQTPDLLCTQAAQDPTRPGKWITNLVLFSPGTRRLDVVYTPQQAMEQGLAPFVDMAKEAELFLWEGETHLIFEYGDGEDSNIGIADIRDGGLVNGRPFYTARDDGSEHVSTMSGLTHIGGENVLFFNRRREKEWGISWMIPDLDIPNSQWEVSPDWVIRAPQNQGLGPKGQLIAFGSCVYRNPQDPSQTIILYHVNDIEPWYAVLEFTG